MRWSKLLWLPVCAGVVLSVSIPALVVAAPGAEAAVAPRTVLVQVVPALPGVQVSIDGNLGTTGSDGTTQVNDPNLSAAAADATLAAPQETLNPPNTRVSLDRVATNPNHGDFSRHLVLELDVSRAVTIHLVTPQGKPVPLTQVTSLTLSDSQGSTTKLSRSQLQGPVWLSTSRPSPVENGVADRNISYSIKSAMIRGTNAVNSGQLRFDAHKTLNWNVPVILHSLTIVGNDLMAARPAGSSVRLTYPNGTVQVIPFGPGHRVTLNDLPRGSYGVKVQGGLLPLASTVRLSKNQTATEIVVTAGNLLEILAIMAIVAAVIVAAGVIGRRRRLAARQAEGLESDAAEPTKGVGGAALA